MDKNNPPSSSWETLPEASVIQKIRSTIEKSTFPELVLCEVKLALLNVEYLFDKEESKADAENNPSEEFQTCYQDIKKTLQKYILEGIWSVDKHYPIPKELITTKSAEETRTHIQAIATNRSSVLYYPGSGHDIAYPLYWTDADSLIFFDPEWPFGNNTTLKSDINEIAKAFVTDVNSDLELKSYELGFNKILSAEIVSRPQKIIDPNTYEPIGFSLQFKWRNKLRTFYYFQKEEGEEHVAESVIPVNSIDYIFLKNPMWNVNTNRLINYFLGKNGIYINLSARDHNCQINGPHTLLKEQYYFVQNGRPPSTTKNYIEILENNPDTPFITFHDELKSLTNLLSIKNIISIDHDTHLKDITTQLKKLKEKGMPQKQIDDLMQFYTHEFQTELENVNNRLHIQNLHGWVFEADITPIKAQLEDIQTYFEAIRSK